MKAALLYFGIVFGAGFVLGPLRVLLLVPRLGERAAELAEIPVMLAVIVWAARFVNRRVPAHPRVRTGLVALALLLAAEVSLGVVLTGRTPREVLFDRDLISGSAYYLALAAFAAMPWVLTAGAPGLTAGGSGPSGGSR